MWAAVVGVEGFMKMRVLSFVAVLCLFGTGLFAQNSVADNSTSHLQHRSHHIQGAAGNGPATGVADEVQVSTLPPFPVLPGMGRSTSTPSPRGVAQNSHNSVLHRTPVNMDGRSGAYGPDMHRSVGGPPVAGNPQQPVPEPETVVLFTMGLAGLAYVMWRRGLFTNIILARQRA